jgi:hypothetical protein
MDWIICVKIGTCRDCLANINVNIRVDKVLGNSWVAERLLAFQEGVCSIDIVVNVLLSWNTGESISQHNGTEGEIKFFFLCSSHTF